MDITYCKKWWQKKKKIVDEINIDEAMRIDENGENYTAIIWNEKNIYAVIDVTKNCYFVRFLDELQNQYLVYEFQKKENGKVFLKGATHFEYNEEILSILYVFNFEENGELFMEKTDVINGITEQKEDVVDVSTNWDICPCFGEYEHILRKERR